MPSTNRVFVDNLGEIYDSSIAAGDEVIGRVKITDGADVAGVTGDALNVGGNVANDIADSGNPVKIGGVANSTAPTSVTAGDRVNAWMGLSGQTIVGLPLGGAGNDATNPGFFTDAGGNPRSLNMVVYNGSTFDRMRGDAANGTDVDVTRLPDSVDTPIFIRETADTFTVGQVSCDATADLICAANPARVRLILTMQGTVDVYIGASGVTSSTGLFFKGTAGNQIVIRNNDAIYGITASGTATLSFMEETT